MGSTPNGMVLIHRQLIMGFWLKLTRREGALLYIAVFIFIFIFVALHWACGFNGRTACRLSAKRRVVMGDLWVVEMLARRPRTKRSGGAENFHHNESPELICFRDQKRRQSLCQRANSFCARSCIGHPRAVDHHPKQRRVKRVLRGNGRMNETQKTTASRNTITKKKQTKLNSVCWCFCPRHRFPPTEVWMREYIRENFLIPFPALLGKSSSTRRTNWVATRAMEVSATLLFTATAQTGYKEPLWVKWTTPPAKLHTSHKRG